MILEFSHVENPILRQLYDTYSFNVIPRIGGLVANDSESYQYLVESIRRFPTQVTLICYGSRTLLLVHYHSVYFSRHKRVPSAHITTDAQSQWLIRPFSFFYTNHLRMYVPTVVTSTLSHSCPTTIVFSQHLVTNNLYFYNFLFRTIFY